MKIHRLWHLNRKSKPVEYNTTDRSDCGFIMSRRLGNDISSNYNGDRKQRIRQLAKSIVSILTRTHSGEQYFSRTVSWKSVSLGEMEFTIRFIRESLKRNIWFADSTSSEQRTAVISFGRPWDSEKYLQTVYFRNRDLVIIQKSYGYDRIK